MERTSVLVGQVQGTTLGSVSSAVNLDIVHQALVLVLSAVQLSHLRHLLELTGFPFLGKMARIWDYVALLVTMDTALQQPAPLHD